MSPSIPRVPERFVVVDLGSLHPPGEPYRQGIDTPAAGAGCINERGEVVGNSDGEVGGRRGFRWTASTGLRRLSLPAGREVASAAHAINDLGHIVGWVRVDGPDYRACLWRGHRRIVLHESLPRHLNGASRAVGINNRGQVVGACDPGGAFLCEEGKARLLNGLGRPLAINDAGWVLGEQALWRDGRVTRFAGGTGFLYARGLNDRGMVVGQVEGRAFLWKSGTLRLLEQLSGGKFGEAVAINNQGWVVGRSWPKMDAANRGTAFLWHDGAAVDLHQRVLWAPGLESFHPEDINDRGQIVGFGFLRREMRALLLEPA